LLLNLPLSSSTCSDYTDFPPFAPRHERKMTLRNDPVMVLKVYAIT
jgi:hypothetical protein